MNVGLCEFVRIIAGMVERRLRHVEWVEYQLTQQRLPTSAGAELFDHVTGHRVDHVVVERLRPEVLRRVHVSDDAAPTSTASVRFSEESSARHKLIA